MFTAHIHTGTGAFLAVTISDADDSHLADLVELVRLDAERTERELEAMSDEALFSQRSAG